MAFAEALAPLRAPQPHRRLLPGHHWRDATDDPKSTPDPRFRPRHWVTVDRVFCTGTCLFVNTATGRFVHKELPVLCNYYVTGTTTDGLLVLKAKTSPHAVCVLNPFTGYLIPFRVTLPDEMTLEVASLSSGSSPSLALLCNRSLVAYIDDPDSLFRSLPRKVYKADPCSECFAMYEDSHACPLTRLADRGIYANGNIAVAQMVFSLARYFNADPVEMSDEKDTLLSEDEAAWNFLIGEDNRFFIQESAGEVLIIIKLKDGMEVFKVDTGRYIVKHLENIGNRAIFLGDYKCMVVAADKFPSVCANCIYYVKRPDFSNDIIKYHLVSGRAEIISKGRSVASGPSTIIELLLYKSVVFHSL
ncbi:hypothetical protein BRADI_2g61275v3 [Brachypodium distachyon]|uniref:KIB1-4 beta-propeller domain-containing protein n=2 Tax=Brachypodium distachyon TaxID=15368 RepID=A0A2K2DH64_BRADI|nr:hypothetical protein BRADI_2g61275v3 [Brachypodium distachyon]